MLPVAIARGSLVALAIAAARMAAAQVEVSSPISLSGDAGSRAVIGLAEPVSPSAAITVGGSVRHGDYAWCSATVAGDTIVLSSSPAATTASDGTVVRFASPVALQGSKHVKYGPGPALPIVRADGLVLSAGQVPQGYVVEAIHAGGRFYAVNTLSGGCPPGFLQAHANLCVEAQSVPGQLFKQGVERCAALGGKICAWDEYMAACSLLQGQLTGLFVDWEWIDDSSNHGHGADQAGRFTCVSQRHFGLIAVTPARTRCCFNPR